MEFTYDLPEHVKEITLNDGFYITMNKNYTATVRNLESLIYAIGSCGIDETFGNIVKESNDKDLNNFYHYLMLIIEKVKGFKTFNSCKHTFVQCENKKQTISIKTMEYI